MKSIVLFDMDGTLTKARQKMTVEMEAALSNLQNCGHEIGIITGSDMNYIKEQCFNLFRESLVKRKDIHFFPCNGTKYILGEKTIYEHSMREYMGGQRWDQLIRLLLTSHYNIMFIHRFPMTGHFFDYRHSMINWCPIGRNANEKDRKIWKDMDKNNKIRQPILENLQKQIKSHIEYIGDLVSSDVSLDIKFGGETSFDIFPKGWDKSFVLNKTSTFLDYDQIYFIGDSCEKNGNDYEIYSHPKVKGFKTSSPVETIEIINQIIKKEK